MEIQEALEIMRALTDGVRPETGEVLAADSVYQYASANWGRLVPTRRWIGLGPKSLRETLWI
jgi:hypothetical protein